MMLSPYADPSDDRLAQLCQMQIFFSLVSSLLLRLDQVNTAAGGESAVNLEALLCTFTFLPLAFAVIIHALDEGLYDYFRDTWFLPADEWLRPRVVPYLTKLRVGAARILPRRASVGDSSGAEVVAALSVVPGSSAAGDA